MAAPPTRCFTLISTILMLRARMRFHRGALDSTLYVWGKRLRAGDILLAYAEIHMYYCWALQR